MAVLWQHSCSAWSCKITLSLPFEVSQHPQSLQGMKEAGTRGHHCSRKAKITLDRLNLGKNTASQIPITKTDRKAITVSEKNETVIKIVMPF